MDKTLVETKRLEFRYQHLLKRRAWEWLHVLLTPEVEDKNEWIPGAL